MVDVKDHFDVNANWNIILIFRAVTLCKKATKERESLERGGARTPRFLRGGGALIIPFLQLLEHVSPKKKSRWTAHLSWRYSSVLAGAWWRGNSLVPSGAGGSIDGFVTNFGAADGKLVLETVEHQSVEHEKWTPWR